MEKPQNRKRVAREIFRNFPPGDSFMVKQTSNIFQKLLSDIYSYLYRPRPTGYVRTLQVILAALTVLIATFGLIYPHAVVLEVDLRQGGPWEEGRNASLELIAITDINYVRREQYETARKKAVLLAPLHIVRDFRLLQSDAGDQAVETPSFPRMLEDDIEALAICRQANRNPKLRRTCLANKVKYWRSLSERELQLLFFLSPQEVSQKVSQMVNTIFQQYAIFRKLPTNLAFREFIGPTVRVRDIKRGAATETDMPFQNVISHEQLRNDTRVEAGLQTLALSLLKESNPLELRTIIKLSRLYLYRFAPCRYDESATQSAREEAAQKVPINDYTFKISRGETIVKSGDVITADIYQALKIHQESRKWEIARQFIALLLQQVIFVSLMLYFIHQFFNRQSNNVGSNLIIFITIWLFSLSLVVIEGIWLSDLMTNEIAHFFGAWVPVGIFCILSAVILGQWVSLPMALYMAFLVFVASKYDGASFLISASIALAAVILGSRIEKRAHFISTTLAITALSCAIMTVSYLYSGRPILADLEQNQIFTDNYLDAMKVSTLSGLSSLIVLGLLPIYEVLFNVPTRFKLIELADTSHPLLQELFRRAPSTWTHTLMVAALSEQACERLGLNTMLIRTGVYFHDIGKMLNAGLFAENRHLLPKSASIERMNPEKAAKLVMEHVEVGVKMAEKARLPREVVAFIREHHGTSTMNFFYHRALKKNRHKVDKSDFQYKGPKPQSKETAIVMIADSVEAASRTLQDMSEPSVAALIQQIIDNKLAENQLDESGLTIGDLREIGYAFRDVITSSFHSRPDYPRLAATTKLESRRNQKSLKKSSTVAGRNFSQKRGNNQSSSNQSSK